MTFSDVIYIYRIVILEFLGELTIFCALFLHKFERKPRFLPRLILSFVGLLAAALPVAWFYASFGETVWGRILVYLFLFLLVTLLVFFCFREHYRTILLACSMAYAVQNLGYKGFLILWTTGEVFHLFDGWGTNFNIFYRLFYYTYFVLFVLAAWFIAIKRITKRLRATKLNYKMLTITLFVLAITILLCSFEDVYFAKLSVIRENRFAEPTYLILRQTGNVFSIVCCVFVLLLSSKSIIENELLEEVEYLKYTIRQSEWQYALTKGTIDMINVKCHDIKYKLQAFAAKENLPPEEVESLQESIKIFDTRIETGNKFLNVMLSEKSLFCEKNGITLSCMIDGSKLDFMELGDLYCLFGNLLDNALEAVKKIEERERRVIDLVVKMKDNMLLIQEENYFNGELRFEDGLPITTKGDTDYHGFGVRSLRMIVKKYGGEMTTYVSDDVFHLNILFGR